jgi:hypothetical protein
MEDRKMKEHLIDLDILVKKYQDIIKSLEIQLEEAKRKFTVISEAIDLLGKEGIFDQEKLFKFPSVLDDRYKEMSMWRAIEDILKSNQNEKLSAEIIYSELIKHGFESKSKNLKGDVYSRLSRLEEKGKLNSTKKGGIKRYFLPKKEEEKIEGEIKQ